MRRTIRDLFQYIRRYPAQYSLGLALLVVFAGLTTFAPLLIGRVIDILSEGPSDGAFGEAMRTVALLIGVMLVAATAMILVRRTILNASWEIQFDIRHDLFRHFTELDAGYYDDHRVGDLMARLTADLNAVRMVVGVADESDARLAHLFAMWVRPTARGTRCRRRRPGDGDDSRTRRLSRKAGGASRGPINPDYS